MEENVALDSSKQKQFVKGIKKLLKVKDKAKGSKKEATDGIKSGKVKKRKRKTRGLVYLSHIPHGFYEHQMTEYFKQFGVVTNARVIRSKRTGMSKGHAFVEFKDPTVAEIVAETMNNYLMGKRLIKAALIPPEKQRRNAKRKHWNAQDNPGNYLRQKMKKLHNQAKTEKEDLRIARRLLSNLTKTKQKLRDMDIDYDFFMPVDIPEQLLHLVEIKKEDNPKSTDVVKKETKSENKFEEGATKKKNKKGKKQPEEIKVKDEEKQPQIQGNMPAGKKSKRVQVAQNKSEEIKAPKQAVNALDNKSKKSKNTVSKDGSADVIKKDKNVGSEISKDNKTAKQKVSKEQEQKEKKLKDAGVKPPEFIKIQNESGDESDSSIDFDSDEYEKMIEQGDSDVPSDGESEESDEDLEEDVTSEEESVIDIPPMKKVKTPPMQKNQPMQSKKQKNKQNANKVQPMKMVPQKEAKPSKKPKFEKKGNQKTLSKVVKKKK